MFSPLQVGNNNKVSISHLFYADDVIFIGKWSNENVAAIVRLLQCFYMASGLSVNFYKSQLMGIGVPINEVEVMASLIGCKASKFPVSYLGVQVGDDMNIIESWRKVVNKITNKLSLWKVVKAIYGEEGKLSSNIRHSYPNTVWIQIVKAISNLKEKGVDLLSFSERKRQGIGLTSFRRHPRGGVESTQWEEMLELLNTINLSSMEDRWACGEPISWCNLIRIKINAMTWGLSLDKLPTRMNLDARDIDVATMFCPICGEHSENFSHLFFYCSFVSQVYVLIARWWDLDVPRLNSYIQLSD
ncbi:RNA-directed DNA polymerase, eukaryota [Tanacetum coccineum]